MITLPKTVKDWFGYGTQRGLNYDPHHFQREEPPTLYRKRDVEGTEEVNRIVITEQIMGGAAEARERSSPKERSSMDSRRKNSAKAHANYEGSGGAVQVYRAEWRDQMPDTEKRSGEVDGGGTVSDPLEKGHETPGVQDRKNKINEIRRTRGRSYSASAQDLLSTKQVDRAKDGTGVGIPEAMRGRANSVVRRDAKSLELVRVNDRSIERSRKRRDGSAVREPMIKYLMDHNTALKLQLEQAQEELRNSEQKKVELRKLINSLQERTRDEAIKRDVDRDTQQTIADLAAKNRKQEYEIRQLKDRLRQSEEKNSHTTNLLQVRTADLRGAEAFLTTADPFSGVDIINMVNGLNAEIFQAAAFMAELLEDPSTAAIEDDRKKNLSKYFRAIEDARSEIGDSLFQHFLDKGVQVRGDPLPLQLALQCLLSRWCVIKTQSFCYNGPFDQMLRGLYQEIQSCEAQAVAGRWRAITFSNIKLLDNQTHADQVLDMAIGLLCLCGWSLNSPRSQKAILSMQQIVKALEKQWLQLKRATKESTIGADFDVVVVDFNTPYDDAAMEDTYREVPIKSLKNGTQVLCSVGVGLQKRVVKRSDGTSLEKTDFLIKSRVALETVLVDIKVGGISSGIISSPTRILGVS